MHNVKIINVLEKKDNSKPVNRKSLKESLKFIKPIWILVRKIKSYIFSLKTQDLFEKVTTIENHGSISIKKYMVGRGNKIIVGHHTYLDNSYIRIVGNNNSLIFGDNCSIGSRSSFWLEGNNITISIGRYTTFTNDVEVNAQEDGSSITLGEDCMLSNHIIIRTSDSHPIYDATTQVRLNQAKPVCIGNHVWIAPYSTIMKGVKINDNAIIGSNTIVTKDVPAAALAVGMPARVVKQNINWTRETLF